MSLGTHAPTTRRPHVRRVLGLLVAVAVLIGVASAARAELTTGGCLAQKRKAWSGLRKCQGTAEAKVLQGKAADLLKCQTKFDDKLAKISAKAAATPVACRYGDNGNGTVTDYDTGLQWEQKVSPGGGASDPHDVDNLYTWNTTFGETTPNGTAFTDFLDELNNCESGDGSTVTGGFAGHCDWRLPSIVELEGIVDVTAGSPTIDPIFGPVASSYWSATTSATDPPNAWRVRFDTGLVLNVLKGSNGYVRAVRAGL